MSDLFIITMPISIDMNPKTFPSSSESESMLLYSELGMNIPEHSLSIPESILNYVIEGYEGQVCRAVCMEMLTIAKAQ